MSSTPPTPSSSPAAPPEPAEMSRRERQIMDVVYRNGAVTVSEVRDQLDDAPSYSAVRALMRILEEKGHLQHRHDGPRYVYSPTVPLEQARRSAASHLLSTFFGDSVEGAVATLLDLRSTELSEGELDRLLQRIEQARAEGR